MDEKRISFQNLSSERKKWVLSRAEKFLALTQSDKEGEAATASRMLGDLLSKYSLTMTDIKTTKNVVDTIGQIIISGRGSKRISWEVQLASAVAGVFDGNILTGAERSLFSGKKVGWKIFFVAANNDLPMIEHFFLYLRRNIGRASRVRYSNVAKRNSYALGMVNTINNRLSEIYKVRKEAMDAESKDLVPVIKALVSKKKDQLHPNTRKAQPMQGGLGEYNAYKKGLEDGHDIPLVRPVGHNGKEPGYIE